MNELLRVIVCRLAFNRYYQESCVSHPLRTPWMIFLGVKPFLENFIESYRFGTHLFLPLHRLEQDVCRKSLIQSIFSSATVWSSHAGRFPSFHCFLWLRQEVWVGWKATANRAYNVFNDYVAQSFWESDLCCPKSRHSLHGLFTL